MKGLNFRSDSNSRSIAHQRILLKDETSKWVARQVVCFQSRLALARPTSPSNHVTQNLDRCSDGRTLFALYPQTPEKVAQIKWLLLWTLSQRGTRCWGLHGFLDPEVSRPLKQYQSPQRRPLRWSRLQAYNWLWVRTNKAKRWKLSPNSMVTESLRTVNLIRFSPNGLNLSERVEQHNKLNTLPISLTQ